MSDMIEMTQREAVYLDMLFRASKTNRNFDHDNRVIDLLLRTVRATALRDAAKDLVDNQNGTQNWLFDRADALETGKL